MQVSRLEWEWATERETAEWNANTNHRRQAGYVLGKLRKKQRQKFVASFLVLEQHERKKQSNKNS